MPRTGTRSIADLLGGGRVRVELPGTDKVAVIEAVLTLLDGAPEVTDLARLRDDVLRREELMSTGVGKGLALPHARTRAVTDTAVALGITAEPVRYGALDGEPVRLVFLIAGPEEDRAGHIKLLSRVSRLMSDDAFRARLLAASSESDVLAAFHEAEDQLL